MMKRVFFIFSRVKFADFPAIIPGGRSKTLLGRELTAEENSIRGTLVTGLTADDIAFLDTFEGHVRIPSHFSCINDS
jgi:hypothetical protein